MLENKNEFPSNLILLYPQNDNFLGKNISHLTILSFGHCLDKFLKCEQCTRLKKIHRRNINQRNDF